MPTPAHGSGPAPRSGAAVVGAAHARARARRSRGTLLRRARTARPIALPGRRRLARARRASACCSTRSTRIRRPSWRRRGRRARRGRRWFERVMAAPVRGGLPEPLAAALRGAPRRAAGARCPRTCSIPSAGSSSRSAPTRIVRAPGARVVVRLPATLRDFFRQRVRIEMAKVQLAARASASSLGARRGAARTAQRCCAQLGPADARSGSGAYLALRAAAHAVARRRYARGRTADVWRQAGIDQALGCRVKVLCPGDAAAGAAVARRPGTRLPPPAPARAAPRRHVLRARWPASRRRRCAPQVEALGVRLEVVRARPGGARPGAGARARRRPPPAAGAALRSRGARDARVAALIARAAASTSCTRSSCGRRRICPGPAGPPVVLDLIDALSANLARRARAASAARCAPVAALGGDAAGALRARADRARGARRSWCRPPSARRSAAASASRWCRTASTPTPSRSTTGRGRRRALALLRQPRLLPERRRRALARRGDLPARARRRCPAAELRLVGRAPGARGPRARPRARRLARGRRARDGAGDRGCDGRRGADARRHRAPEQGARGDGGRHARWSRRRRWRRRSTCAPGEHLLVADDARGAGRGRGRRCCATRRAPAPWRPRPARVVERRYRWEDSARGGGGGLGGGGARTSTAMASRALRAIAAFDISAQRAPARQGVAGSLGRAGRRATCWRPSSRTCWPSSCASSSRSRSRRATCRRSASRRSTTTGRRCWLAQLATLYFLGLYETRAVLAPARRTSAPIVAAAVLQALVLIAVYFFRQDLVFPRSIFVVFAGLNAAFLRGLAARLLGAARRLSAPPRAGGRDQRRGRRGDRGHPRRSSGSGSTSSGSPSAARTARGPLRSTGVPVLGTARGRCRRSAMRHAIDEVIIASDPTWQDRAARRVQPRAAACARASRSCRRRSRS